MAPESRPPGSRPPENRRPLENRQDLERLLDTFYDRVKVDPLIGPIFNDVAGVNWPEHVANIYNFWDTLLFGAENYRGRPFPPHVPLELRAEHFRRWLELFFFTVDESFVGLKADEIKTRAYQIGQNFHGRLEGMRRAEE
jgi:hemoglobin